MNMSQIHEFIILAKFLNFTESAAKLHIAQPTLTKHIQALESEVGVELLVRTTQEIHLTPAGKIFFEGAISIIETYENMVNNIKTYKNSLEVCVGGLIEYAVVRSTLGKTLREMRKNSQNISIIQKPSNYCTSLYQSLINGEIDILISHIAKPKFEPNIDSYLLYDDLAYAVVSSMNPLANKSELTLHDICGSPLIRLSGSYYEGGWLTIKHALQVAGCDFITHPIIISTPSELSSINITNEVFIISKSGLEGQTLMSDYGYVSVPFDMRQLKFSIYALTMKNPANKGVPIVMENMLNIAKEKQLCGDADDFRTSERKEPLAQSTTA